MANVGYEPIFKGALPESWQERWSLIRKFINFWCMPEGEPLADRSQEKTPLILQAESLHAGNVSPSIRQWLALLEEASLRNIPQIRDCCLIEPIENHFDNPAVRNATTILMQAEGDIFWTVANEHFAADDPPVDVYQLFDEESSPYFVRYGSVSEFALAYLCSYNEFAKRRSECFVAHGKGEDAQEAKAWFEHSLVLESQNARRYRFLELLERRDAVAFVSASGRFDVSLFCRPEDLEMPPFLVAAMQEHLKAREEFRTRLGRED
jgi:hypothetical protein